MTWTKKISTLFIVSILITMTGCVATMPTTTKDKAFPGMYTENPKSILILPPMNESTAAEAKTYYSTTIEIPLALHGYYVFPNELATELLQQQGISDAEVLKNVPLNKFAEYFGADAVMFTKIKRWDVSYTVVSSSLTVAVEAEIKSTKTNETLWKYEGVLVQNLTAQNQGGGLAGLVAAMVATAVNTAVADYTEYATQLNHRVIYSAPYGVYHPNHLKDQGIKIHDQSAAVSESDAT